MTRVSLFKNYDKTKPMWRVGALTGGSSINKFKDFELLSAAALFAEGRARELKCTIQFYFTESITVPPENAYKDEDYPKSPPLDLFGW